MTPEFQELPPELWQTLSHGTPADEALRVIADWFTETGNPRGEFISKLLESRPMPDAPTFSRLSRLFESHRRDWLGQLSAIAWCEPDDVQWEHQRWFANQLPPQSSLSLEFEQWQFGFPQVFVGEVRGTTRGAPEWHTVRELILVHAFEGELPTELEDETTAGLQRINFSLDRGLESGWSEWGDSPEDRARERIGAYLQRIGRQNLLAD